MPSRSSRTALAALAVVAVLSACSDPVAQPEAALELPVAMSSAAPATGPNHFVLFKNGAGIPGDFADAVAAAGGAVEATYEEVGVAVVSGLSASGASQLGKHKGISIVEPEPIVDLVEPTGVSEPASATPSSPADPSLAFFYPVQWNMRAIEADAAWAAGRLGSPDITVAILDTGIDYLHQDLAGRVDLSRSVSFLAADNAYAAFYFPSRHPITDLHYHGTHVASTVVSNGFGAAGVTSGVTLIGVKVCSVLGGCPGSAIFAGIQHAVLAGADVANMSLGGGFTKKDFPGAVSAYQRLFNWAKQSGTTFVVAAGNSGIDLDHDGNGFATYCSVANVVCVSATGPTSGGTFGPGPWLNPDAPAFYTNHGRSAIDVAAPGGNTTFVVGACSSSSLVIAVCQNGPFFYVGLRGTSMAAPHVSGVAALIAEDVGSDPAQIRARLHQSADDLGQPGTDPFYGKGRINAARATGN